MPGPRNGRIKYGRGPRARVSPGDVFGSLTVVSEPYHQDRQVIGGYAHETYKVLVVDVKCDCEKTKTVLKCALLTGNTKTCGDGLHRRGANGTRWKGGRIYDAQGYVKVTLPEHARSNSHGYVLEHIVIMEDYLGRPLRPGETVHHKNTIRDDNDISNLELWASNQPAGGRVTDLIAWARKILETYEAEEERLAA